MRGEALAGGDIEGDELLSENVPAVFPSRRRPVAELIELKEEDEPLRFGVANKSFGVISGSACDILDTRHKHIV